MFAIESFESDFQESFFIKLCVPVFFQLVHWEYKHTVCAHYSHYFGYYSIILEKSVYKTCLQYDAFL